MGFGHSSEIGRVMRRIQLSIFGWRPRHTFGSGRVVKMSVRIDRGDRSCSVGIPTPQSAGHGSGRDEGIQKISASGIHLFRRLRADAEEVSKESQIAFSL